MSDAARSLRFNGKGRVARYAHGHCWARRMLWRFNLLPNVLGPFYRSGA